MARHPWNRGFTAAECILCLALISCCLMITGYTVPKHAAAGALPLLLKARLLEKQAEAMLHNERREILLGPETIDELPVPAEIDGDDIRINGVGNISQAQTILITAGARTFELKLWLGTGRLVTYEP